MPGVVVTTAVRTGPTGVTIAPSSTWFVAGTAERGSTTAARLVTSLSDFEAMYGDYNASYTLHQHVRTFFEEGGARCYVARAVGASTTLGTRSLNASGATPALRLDAANAGVWSSRVKAEVIAGSGSNFIVRLYYDDVLVYATPEVADASSAAAAINSSSTASIYVTATALAGSSALVTAAPAALSAGVAATTPTDAQLVSALDLFGSELGAGAVSIPESFSGTTYAGVIAHADAMNRIAVLGFDPASDASAAVTTAATYATSDGADATAFYFPHVTIPSAGSVTLTISPESYVAAKRSLAHNSKGAWQAGAGLLSKADFVTGVAQTVDKTAGDTLDAGRVNAIRVIQGTVRIYGARSVSSDETNFRYITYRDLLNHIVVEAEKALEDLVFSTIDGRRTVFGRTEARLVGLLEPIRLAGGLYEAFDVDGNQVDPGYSVEVSDALNPVTQLAEGLVKARIGVRVSSVGDRIELVIVKSNLTSSVV